MAFAVLTASAQVQDARHHSCGAHTYTQRHLEQQGLSTDLLRSLPSALNTARGGTYTIPVVVHVVYNNNAENVTTGTIQALIAELNQDYSASNADLSGVRSTFTNSIGAVNFQFCLAQVDPNGNATTGITRTQTTDTWFDPDNQTDAMKSAPLGVAPWDTERYLNIWICDITSGASGSTITVGYAYLPTGGVVGSNIDGLVIDYDYGTQIGARTATHEIGHYFGLLHTFDDDGTCVNADGFTDTPNSNSPTFSCSNTNLVKCGVLTQYENFMDYSDCTAMFTDQQAAYMANVLTGVRDGLLLNTACSGPTTGICIPTSANGTSGDDYINTVVLEDIQNGESGGNTEPTYTDFSSLHSTSLARNGVYGVLLQSGNYQPDRYAVWIDYDQDDTFEATEKLGEFATTVVSQVQSIPFTVPSGAALGSTTMRVRGVFVNTGETDPLDPCFAYGYGETEDYGITITAAIPGVCIPSSLSGTADGDFINGVELVAISNTGSGSIAAPHYIDLVATDRTYLTRGTVQSLTIQGGDYAPDHYSAWIDYDQDELFEATEKLGEFITAAVNETQVINFTVPTNATLGDTRMRVRGVFHDDGEPSPTDPCYPYWFGETEDYGITIETSTGLLDEPPFTAGVFPNPSTGLVTVELPSAALATVQVIDLQGRLVRVHGTSAQRNQINLVGLASGSYLIRVVQGDNSITQRLELIGTTE